MTETKPNRRWFSFSIRDLFLITAVVAIGVAWWLDHRRLAEKLDSLYGTDADVLSIKVEKLTRQNQSLMRQLQNAENNATSPAVR